MQKTEQRILRILAVLLGLTLISFWMLSGLYAKYVTGSQGEDSARVAAFRITDANDIQETYVLNPSLSADEAKKVTVTIENASEAALRYTFSFETEGNLPLQITGSGPEGVMLTQEEQVWTTERPAGSGAEESYTFTLSMSNEEQNYQYAGGVESIRLTVRTEQID